MRQLEAVSVGYMGYEQPQTLAEADIEASAIDAVIAKLELKKKELISASIRARIAAAEATQEQPVPPTVSPDNDDKNSALTEIQTAKEKLTEIVPIDIGQEKTAE